LLSVSIGLVVANGELPSLVPTQMIGLPPVTAMVAPVP
jgi:hypothetical protein